MRAVFKSFKFKIIVPTVTILIILVICLSIFLTVRFSRFSSSLIEERLNNNINSFEVLRQDSLTKTTSAAHSMVNRGDIKDAVSNKNTDKIVELLSAEVSFYGIDFFTVCDDEGVIIGRTHSDLIGDSISHQQNVIKALAGIHNSCFEEGNIAKVSSRSSYPVYDNLDSNKIVGVIIAGINYSTNEVVENLKLLYACEITVYLKGKDESYKVIASTIKYNGEDILGRFLDDDTNILEVIDGYDHSKEHEMFGEKYVTYYKPILNDLNQMFAIIALSANVSDLVKMTNNSIRDGIIFGLCGLIVSGLLLYIVISLISKPITKLSDDMQHIANGILDVNINTKGEDEIGHLGKSLQKIADILNKLLDDINTMIAEQEKGNTDHHFDPKEFLGDYKILAENILELTTYSTKDQLTNIPNRRSFDNRLDMEWKKAIREGKPISILMIDIDKFKVYNDTFGHHQGDVALQSVALTIKNSLNRVFDFAARWGGEEFVVLLPSTELEGTLHIGEKIRAEVENMVIPCENPIGNKVTISVGANIVYPHLHDSKEKFVEVADEALYKAKEAGRNRVVHLKE